MCVAVCRCRLHFKYWPSWHCSSLTCTVVMLVSGLPCEARYCRGPSYPCSSRPAPARPELPGLPAPAPPPDFRSLSSEEMSSYWQSGHCPPAALTYLLVLLGSLLPLLLLYEPPLLVQLVLPHVGGGEAVHPADVHSITGCFIHYTSGRSRTWTHNHNTGKLQK